MKTNSQIKTESESFVIGLVVLGVLVTLLGIGLYTIHLDEIVTNNNRLVTEAFEDLTMNSDNQSKDMGFGIYLESQNTDAQFLIAMKLDPEFDECEKLMNQMVNTVGINLSYVGDVWIDNLTPSRIAEMCSGDSEQPRRIVFQGDRKKDPSKVRRLEYASE